ncbi:MAG: sigma-70 family RNA polymerase sigma factor [Cyclobacteriaceae bacterium]|nr:sigma-70 family RNA polymerase sigma factor [Cyclobacteriaceae bacterium]
MKRDEERKLLQDIRLGGPLKRHDALQKLYDLSFTSVKNYVLKNSGTLEDAKDIFQDGVTAFYYELLNDKFREEASLKTYLFSICKNLWLLKLRRQLKQSMLAIEGMENVSEEMASKELDVTKIKELINSLKKDCQTLLIGFYYEQKSMRELMELFGLGSEQVARTKKLRCMSNLIDLVRERGLTFESFLQ